MPRCRRMTRDELHRLRHPTPATQIAALWESLQDARHFWSDGRLMIALTDDEIAVGAAALAMMEHAVRDALVTACQTGAVRVNVLH